MVLLASGTTLETEGLENVPKDTPVLYVANHRSYYDIVTCYTLVKNNTGFISKKRWSGFHVLADGCAILTASSWTEKMSGKV